MRHHMLRSRYTTGPSVMNANRLLACARIPTLALLVLLAAATTAQAQISFVADLGSNEANSTVATSLSITTSASAPAGASVIVMAVDLQTGLGNPASSVACTDSKGDSYTTDVMRQDDNTVTAICATHQIPAALPSGSSITVTWSGQSQSQSYRIRAFAVTGLVGQPGAAHPRSEQAPARRVRSCAK